MKVLQRQAIKLLMRKSWTNNYVNRKSSVFALKISLNNRILKLDQIQLLIIEP